MKPRAINLHILFCCLLSLVLTSSCKNAPSYQKPKITVSIPPLKFLIERIAGDSFDCHVLVPPGASPHTYEPPPKQVLNASKAVLWFRIGEPFENRVLDVFKSHNKEMVIVDLREHVDLIPVQCCHHNHLHSHEMEDKDACDSHIWLSPRMLIQETKDITNALVAYMPKYRLKFEKNCKELIEELLALDLKFSIEFANPLHKTILVSHPAFGYFSRDYNLEQLSIEIEGKDPTAKQLSDLLIKAREKKISIIFIQEQYNTKGAELIAKELRAKTAILDPYAENVIENLQAIAKAFLQE